MDRTGLRFRHVYGHIFRGQAKCFARPCPQVQAFAPGAAKRAVHIAWCVHALASTSGAADYLFRLVFHAQAVSSGAQGQFERNICGNRLHAFMYRLLDKPDGRHQAIGAYLWNGTKRGVQRETKQLKGPPLG